MLCARHCARGEGYCGEIDSPCPHDLNLVQRSQLASDTNIYKTIKIHDISLEELNKDVQSKASLRM